MNISDVQKTEKLILNENFPLSQSSVVNGRKFLHESKENSVKYQGQKEDLSTDFKIKNKGIHQCEIRINFEGEKVFFKRLQKPLHRYAEIVGSRLANYISGGNLVPVAKDAKIDSGIIQPFVSMTSGPFAVAKHVTVYIKKSGQKQFDPRLLNLNQQTQLFSHLIADWVICNYDTHTGQFGIDNEENVIGFDKGLAFKFFGLKSVSFWGQKSGPEPTSFNPKVCLPPLKPNKPVYSPFSYYLKKNPEKLKEIRTSNLIMQTLNRCKSIDEKILLECGLGDYIENHPEISKSKKFEFFTFILERAKNVENEIDDYFSESETK